MANEEVWIVPFFGQGHLFPLMELCKQISSRNFKTLFVISSNFSSSVPDSLRRYPLVQIAEIPEADPPSDSSPQPHHRHQHNQMSMTMGLEKLLLSTRSAAPPVCAILDIMMGWTADIFLKFEIPTVAFFTSGACSAAMEYAMWKAQPLDIKPGETRLLPGLPEEMGLSLPELKRQSRGPPSMPNHGGGPPMPMYFPPPGPSGPHPRGGPGKGRMGPPQPGDQPRWVNEVDRSVALMINTCDDLERPFLQYLCKQIGKPVWGVGPLLPQQFWKGKSTSSIVHDHEFRISTRKSNVTEKEVIEWLDSKPRGSVLYVSFGSEVGPTAEELLVLAEALEEASSKPPFIWVVQTDSGRRPGPLQDNWDALEEYFLPHHGLSDEVGKRGLIIHGWAPQLLILSHPSTGGFLSHCGWNSTVEALGHGVPFLVWPIRGDQHHDAKLVVSFLKVGYYLISTEDLELDSEFEDKKIKKEDIVKGIEKLMGDEEQEKEDMKQRAISLSAAIFGNGFPTSSVASLDAFADFLAKKLAPAY